MRNPFLGAVAGVLGVLGCMPVDLGGAPEVGGVAAGRCVPFARDAKPFVPVVTAPPPARPCLDGATLRARAAAWLHAGRLDRTIRVLARAAERCPVEASASADLLASARASLQALIGDPEVLLVRAIDAWSEGDAGSAHALRDAALVAAEREQEARCALLAPNGATSGPGHRAPSSCIAHAVVTRRGASTHVTGESGPSGVQRPRAPMQIGAKFAASDAADLVKLLRFTPDGQRLVTSGSKRLTAVWDLATGHLLRAVVASSTPGLFEPWILALSSDGRIAANRHKDTLELWSTDDGARLRGLAGHEKSSQYSEEIDSAAFSNSGRYVATGDEMGTLRVFRVADGAPMLSFDAQRSRLVAMAWAPGDRLLATASRDEAAVRIRDAATGLTAAVLPTEEDEMHRLAWSAGGRVVVASDMFHEARAWDLATCRATRLEDWPPCHVFEDGSCGGLAIFGLAVSPSGDRAFGVFDDDGVVVWDTASGRRIAWWRLPEGERAWGGAVSDDGRLFGVGTLEGVQLFRLAGGALAPLVTLVVPSGSDGEDGLVLDTASGSDAAWPRPTGYYDASGRADSELQCVIGERVWPLDACAERLHVKGLLAKRAAGLPIEPEDTGD